MDRSEIVSASTDQEADRELVGELATRLARLKTSIADLAQPSSVRRGMAVARAAGYEWPEPFTLDGVAGLLGVGLWESDGLPRACVYLDDSLSDEYVATADRLCGALGIGDVPAFSNAVIVPMTRPDQYLGAGEEVRTFQSAGTFGCPITFSDGSYGITTAGHVASYVGELVMDSKGLVGAVEATDFLANSSREADVADLATIRLDQDLDGLQGVRLDSMAPLAIGVNVRVFGAISGQLTSRIIGVSPSLSISPYARGWADVGLTEIAISQRGDSGAPVTRGEESILLGHIVGGSSKQSVIQAAAFQLASRGVTLRFLSP
jgi:hypothetical protein